MLIKDGNHGYTARVSADGKLNTFAVTKEMASYNSLVFGKSFVLVADGSIAEPNSTTKGIISLTNNSDTEVITISEVTHQFLCPTTTLPAVGEYFTCYVGGTTPTGGTAITSINTNVTSNNDGNQVSLKDGFTQTNKGSIVHRAFINNGQLYNSALDGIYVLGTNDTFSMYWTSATANTNGRVISIIKYTYVNLDTLKH